MLWVKRGEEMKDYFNNEIVMMNAINGHAILTGMSGMGKTYALTRLLEEAAKNKKRILILDYSGSFSVFELEDKKFKIEGTIERVVVGRDKVVFPILDLVSDDVRHRFLADILNDIAEITGRVEKKMLSKELASIADQNIISFGDIEKVIEKAIESYYSDERMDMSNKMEKIYTKLGPIFDYANIEFCTALPEDNISPTVRIVEMDELPDECKRMIAKLYMACIWQQVKRRHSSVDVLVLDELQNLRVKENTAFASLLREGRKYNLSVYMASQYYPRELAELLEQASHRIVFRPVNSEVKNMAKVLFGDEYQKKISIIRNLKKGQAIYQGYYRYRVNNLVHSGTCIVYF